MAGRMDGVRGKRGPRAEGKNCLAPARHRGTTLEEFANPAAVRAGEPLELDVLNKVVKLFGDLQEVDAGPTAQQEIACGDLQRSARSVLERWPAIAPEVQAFNAQLQAVGLEPIKFP